MPINSKQFDSDRYCVLMNWCWRRLNTSNHEALRWGYISHPNPTDASITEYDIPVDIVEVERLQNFAMKIGSAERIQSLFRDLEFNYHQLADNNSLLNDGMTHLPLEKCATTNIEINAGFHNYVTSFNRFVNTAESELKLLFGPGSDACKSWKDATAMFYDGNIGYALCYNIRNVIEHEPVMVNMVCYDTNLELAGFAINLEHELLDTGIKDKARLQQFADERMIDGETPWVSIGRFLKTSYGCAGVLLGYFTDCVMSGIIETPVYYNVDGVRVNCLIQHVPEDEKYKRQPCHRVYKIPEARDCEAINMVALEILEENVEAC